MKAGNIFATVDFVLRAASNLRRGVVCLSGISLKPDQHCVVQIDLSQLETPLPGHLGNEINQLHHNNNNNTNSHHNAMPNGAAPNPAAYPTGYQQMHLRKLDGISGEPISNTFSFYSTRFNFFARFKSYFCN